MGGDTDGWLDQKVPGSALKYIAMIYATVFSFAFGGVAFILDSSYGDPWTLVSVAAIGLSGVLFAVFIVTSAGGLSSMRLGLRAMMRRGGLGQRDLLGELCACILMAALFGGPASAAVLLPSWDGWSAPIVAGGAVVAAMPGMLLAMVLSWRGQYALRRGRRQAD